MKQARFYNHPECASVTSVPSWNGPSTGVSIPVIMQYAVLPWCNLCDRKQRGQLVSDNCKVGCCSIPRTLQFWKLRLIVPLDLLM